MKPRGHRRAGRIGFVVWACLVPLGVQPAAAGPPPFDTEAFRIVPIVDILRKESGHLRLTLDPDWHEDEREAGLAEIAAMTPHRRTLFWLVYFEDGFEYPWSRGDRDGLETFFFRDSGFYVQPVREALLSAGLASEAAQLGQAEALFHPAFPPAARERQNLILGSDKSRFDRDRLVAIEQSFDDRETLARKITTYIANTPDLTSWAEGQRSVFDEYDRLRNLTDRLDLVPGASDFAKLRLWPAAYRNIRLAHACDQVLEDGEFSQLFEDFDEDWIQGTIAALRKIGLEDQARQLEAGYAASPKPYPASDKERHRLKWADDGALDKRLNTIKGPLCGEQDTALIAYAKREGVLPR